MTPPVKSLLLTVLSSQMIKSKFHILRGSKMYKAHVLLQAAACFWTPPFMPSLLYFNMNLQVSICTQLSATETGTKSGRNLKAENHNWTVNEKVERQISFSCYLGCITTCFFKYKTQTVMPPFFSKTTYMKLYIYDTHSVIVFSFSDSYSTWCDLPKGGFCVKSLQTAA